MNKLSPSLPHVYVMYYAGLLSTVTARWLKPCNFTARKRSLRRLCFHRCLSVHGGVCSIACWDTPPGQTPPWADTPWADNPLGRHPPCPVDAGIRSTSGYASHWNAFLFSFGLELKIRLFSKNKIRHIL